MVSGMVVKGVVIDSAALAAGAVAASRVTFVSEMLLKKHPTKFMAKSGRMMPGKQFVLVTGGLDDGNLTIASIDERKFRKLGIKHFKEPTDTIQDKIHYYIPVLAPAKAPAASLPPGSNDTGFPPENQPLPDSGLETRNDENKRKRIISYHRFYRKQEGDAKNSANPQLGTALASLSPPPVEDPVLFTGDDNSGLIDPQTVQYRTDQREAAKQEPKKRRWICCCWI